MSTNPLKTAGKLQPAKGSVYSAGEYAARAEAEGDKHKAKLWWDAQRDGWDEANYDPVAAAEHKEKIRVAQGKWVGK